MLKAAEARGATPAQVLLRWALHRNAAVIPKSARADRMAENAACFGPLDARELSEIDALAARAPAPHEGRLCWKSDPLRLLDFG